MVTRSNIIHDVLFFIKDDLDGQITDPFSSKRSTKSKFIMTSYPQKAVQYPVITLKITNIEALRAGMQTTAQDITLTLEIRIWARNEKEKETIYQQVSNRLKNIQFTATGSIANNIHDYNELSAVEIDEPGEAGGKVIKSRILQCQYRFYNLT